MLNVYRVRLYPNKTACQAINSNIGCCRWVYNEALKYCQDIYEQNQQADKDHQQKRPSGYDLCHRLVKIKNEFPWLADADSQALKFACLNVDQAYKNFFRRVRQGVNPGFPRFKSRYRGSQSYTATAGASIHINFVTPSVKIPKIGWIRCRGLRWFEGKIQRATIRRMPTGKYYCSILTKNDLPEPVAVPVKRSDQLTAIDLGIRYMVVVESGTKNKTIEHPHFMERMHKKLAREQKKLARKKNNWKRGQPVSSNYKKQQTRVARIYEKITDARRNYAHHVSRDLVTMNDALVLEDIDIKGIMQKLAPVHDENGNYLPNGRKLQKKWNRFIADASWYSLSQMIQYKAARDSKPVILIDPVVGPNKICSACGFYHDAVTLENIRWTCPECNRDHDRNKNCLKNLKSLAFSVGTAEQVVKPENNQ